MKKKMVYTVLTGNYDALCTIKHEPNTDYYCFTNNLDLVSEEWKIEYIENNDNLSDLELSRKYKILGNPELEKKYDIIIYIDANMYMQKPFDEIIKENCDFSKYSIFFLKHHERNCTYEEAEECMKLQLGNPALIRTQMDYYIRQKFPSDLGLATAGIIIRKSAAKKKSDFSLMLNEWYRQVHLFSKRDQLSLMYCLWKYNISYKLLNQNLYASDWVIVDPHRFSRQPKGINAFGNGLCNGLGLIDEKNKYSPEKDDYHCNIGDKNDSHASIARRVAEGSKVLDIGCGVGIIGELLFKNKKCINYGVEIDSESYDIAKKSNYYKKVFNISIENPEERKIIENEHITFDYIILADVLEHVYNPVEILYQVSKWLSKDGKILISVPNIAYLDIIAGLINDKFNYQKTGILDNTHLHFFTKKSFIEMISNWRITYQLNYDVEWIDSTKVDDFNSQLLISQLLDESGNHMVVQNIYELSRLGDEEIPVKMLRYLNESDVDYYLEINRRLKEQVEQAQKMKITLEKLEGKIKNLENEKLLIGNELESVIKSKSWKMTEPLRKLMRKLSK